MIYLTSKEKFSGVKNLELNEIKFCKFSINLENFDALIITSKNSIYAMQENKIALDKRIQIYSIGDACSKAAIEFGFEKIYTAKNSHGDEFGFEILPLLSNKKILFLKAKDTVSNISLILESGGVKITKIVAYKNICKILSATQKPLFGSVIVFTAPSAVRNFIQNFGWDESFKAVSIGETTAKELKKVTTPIVSKIQSINECIKLAKALI